MLKYTQDMVSRYLQNDYLLPLLMDCPGRFASNTWLKASAAKRMIYHHLYGDLLRGDTDRKAVLDIGGGFSALTGILAKQHDYTLVEIAAHEQKEELSVFLGEIPEINCVLGD